MARTRIAAVAVVGIIVLAGCGSGSTKLSPAGNASDPVSTASTVTTVAGTTGNGGSVTPITTNNNGGGRGGPTTRPPIRPPEPSNVG